MAMNFAALGKLKQGWDTFKENHPKFPAFLDDISSRGIVEGTILEMTVKYPDGSQVKTNLVVKSNDIELLNMLQSLK